MYTHAMHIYDHRRHLHQGIDRIPATDPRPPARTRTGLDNDHASQPHATKRKCAGTYIYSRILAVIIPLFCNTVILPCPLKTKCVKANVWDTSAGTAVGRNIITPNISLCTQYTCATYITISPRIGAPLRFEQQLRQSLYDSPGSRTVYISCSWIFAHNSTIPYNYLFSPLYIPPPPPPFPLLPDLKFKFLSFVSYNG